jgi:hypothetical protein
MVDAVNTSEVLVSFYETTRCNSPEDSHLDVSVCYTDTMEMKLDIFQMQLR